ncbi:MAG: hypothetical protein Fur0032_15380 [Terrimicrobiaceae bacterium]
MSEVISNSPSPEKGLIGDSAVFTRRKMFGLLAATGSGLLLSTPGAHAFLNFFESYAPASSSLLADLGIPSEWRDRLGPYLPGYVQYVKSLGLQVVKVKAVIQPHTKVRGGVRNTLPPKAIWKNIRYTLKVVDGLASRLELPPSELVSVYRSPAYNARCAGAKSNSYHIRNNAIDVKFPCSPGKVAAMAKEMRAAGLFRGGVGRYGGFTHIDTRGSNVDWRG